MSYITLWLVLFQALELQQYLQSKGADVPTESSGDLHQDLSLIIKTCDVCFTSSAAADVEAVLNSIVSMIILVSTEHCIDSDVFHNNLSILMVSHNAGYAMWSFSWWPMTGTLSNHHSFIGFICVHPFYKATKKCVLSLFQKVIYTFFLSTS